MLAAMSRGAEEKKRYEDPSYSPHPLTYQELVNLPLLEYKPIQAQLASVMGGCLSEQKIKTEASKKRKSSGKITLNLQWFLFYGRMLHMQRQEILCTTYGEMCDMISCLAVYNGSEKIKQSPSMRMEDILSLR